MRTLGLVGLTVISLALVASCSKNDAQTAPDGGGGAGGGCGPRPQFGCVETVNGACADVAYDPVCTGGHWTCEANRVLTTECRCFFPLSPGCVCTPQGEICPDGGAGGAGGAGGSGGGCAGERFPCAPGHDGVCGDATSEGDINFSVPICVSGQWTCVPGQIPASQCHCAGPDRPGCTCGDGGWSCPDGGAGAGGHGGSAGNGGAGGHAGAGSGGVAGAGGASPARCDSLTALSDCDARADCHAVFEDPHNCRCAGIGCCAHFARCASGAARCAAGPVSDAAAPPYCEGPYVISYTDVGYEGCARATACETPAP